MSTGDLTPGLSRPSTPSVHAAVPATTLLLPLGLLDSGTTRTRLRIWDGERVSWQGERLVGARDVAQAGASGPLVHALHDLIASVPAAQRPVHLACSGMITSNVGLLEVPHVNVPAGAAEVAAGLQHMAFPELPPIMLIPGIRTPPQPGPDGWQDADVLRGEEVEVFGLRETLNLHGSAQFLHLGSHHKLVQMDAAGHVTRTVTSLAGEALLALSQHTILASSVPALGDGAPLDPAAWRSGLQAARTRGTGRALFLVRLGQQLGTLTRESAGAFLHGVAAHLTLDVLRGSPRDVPLVIYGHDAQATLLTAHLARDGWSDLRHCDADCVDRATVLGTLAVLRAAGALHA